MGIAPSELKKMTVWETTAVMQVWSEAHGASADGKLSNSEADELWDFVNDQNLPTTLAAARGINGSGNGGRQG
jgi:hypothetical protein